ncbi:hypothetical protein [Jannaschia aquimarina]|uniref:hypothetical protein n=1 Tax=Jannaschia aquimarina TaxID=935700 RepID=UPI0005C4769A|nr:hypothetical protein [Jannaschia aquimarina]
MIDVNTLKDALVELSDKEDQLRLWARIDNKTGEISSFEEATVEAFDSSGVAKLISRGETDAPDYDDLLPLMLELGQAVDAVDTRLPPVIMIASEAMERVRSIAYKVLTHLQ